MGLVTSSLRSVWESWHPNRNTARNDNMENDQTPPSMVDRLLHLASLNGHHQYARLLLYVGANVDATNQERWTPLHVSSFHGHHALAVLLLDRGADVNATEGRGLTPLHLSFQNGHETVARFQLDRGAGVRLTSDLPSQDGHRDVSFLLIERGADVCATTCDGRSPLHMCSAVGHKEVVDLLLSRGAEVDRADESGFTAIHYACQEGKCDVVKALLADDRQARTDTVAVGGQTPLSSACDDGKWDVVRFLIERYNGRAIVEHTTRQLDNDFTPLICLAIQKGAPSELVKLLVVNGASVHDTDSDGSSSLHYACSFGSFDVVEFIHSKGVLEAGGLNPDWDVVDANGLNPVHFAVKRRDADFHQKIKDLLGTKMFNRLEQMEVSPRMNRLYSDFEDVAEIGSGSYGKVFKGLWKKNNEWYAMKRLEPRERFTEDNIKQELDWLDSRKHSPFITLTHWFWSEKHGDSSIYYIVMELCDSDLYHWMEANPCGKRDRGEVLQYISDIAAGLRFLHYYDRGLIHRDLAPRNILLKKGVVVGSDPPRTVAKISDLGLASGKTSAATGEKFPPHPSDIRGGGGPFGPPELPSVVTSTPLNYNESVDIYNAGKIFHQLLASEKSRSQQPNWLTDEFRREQPLEISSFLDRMLASREERPNAIEVEKVTKKWLADYKQCQGR
ncbi:unnamed protein product [Cyprideis torosa]|uniref:Uncharacterized protein n=1 Tax=Cyprideis torosa TaxID=163714 RepID=A0A7R8WFK3_9CRUS|nr:unnamed protein product [Cyprideis torosa]CAG0896961.1 unnamed protein product [Cyprideis torosa]